MVHLGHEGVGGSAVVAGGGVSLGLRMMHSWHGVVPPLLNITSRVSINFFVSQCIRWKALCC